MDPKELETLAHSASEADRRKAAREAESTHDLRVVPTLVPLARSDPDAGVRLVARRALRILETRVENALNALRSVPRDDSAPPARSGAPARKPAAEPSVSLTSPEPKERRDAVLRILEKKQKERVPDLIERLTIEPEGWVRSEIALALGRLGEAEQVQALLSQMLLDPVSRVRANAVEALGQLRPAGFEAMVEDLLDDKDRRVRANVLAALRSDTHPQAARVLDGLVGSKDVLDRRAAVHVLAEIRSEAALGRLRGLTSDPEAAVRDAAAAALRAVASKPPA